MAQGIPDLPTDDSKFGTRVHAFLSGGLQPENLTPEELDCGESCQAIESKVLAQWRLRNQIPDDAVILTIRDSERLWLEIHGERECSGVADAIHSWNHHVLVLDFKTLPGDHKDSNDNLQLRCLAILANRRADYGLESADVAIIQPLVTHSPAVCHYDQPALHQAMEELVSILAASKKPDASLIPGDQCRFCRANAVCPAVHKEVETMASLTIHESGLTVSDEDLAALRARCGAATKMIESIKAECFRRAEANPAAWKALGWEITEGAGKRAVDNVAEVAERLHDAGVPYPDITNNCSVAIGKVEALTRQATGEKGLKLKQAVDRILTDCVSIKKPRPSLKRVGMPDDEDR